MRYVLVLVLALSQVLAMLPAPAAALAAQPLVYTSPSADARHINPATSLAFRQGSPFDRQAANAALFSIVGSKSGKHGGSVLLSDDALTLVYYPVEPFAYGETVSVSVLAGLKTGSGTPITPSRHQFLTLERPMTAVAPQDEGMDNPAPAPTTDLVSPQATSPRYYTRPEFSNVMTTTVTTPAQGTAGGYVFVAGMAIMTRAEPGFQIVDNGGEPVYIQPTPAGMLVGDFKVQTVKGTPYLTYHIGAPTAAWSDGSFYVMDRSYTIVDTWTIGNGYGADVHDLQLLDNGHALLHSYVPIPVDLSPYGGPANGEVIDSVIQEQDSAKNVVFEWHGSDYIPLTDTYQGLTGSPVDYLHTNALELDHDGNLLVSCRSLSQILKINRQTGGLVWRLGGRNGDFTFTNDIGFSFQHDIRRLASGHITLFDNGNQHRPPFSRAVEYQIDEVAKTATLVWQFQQTPSTFAPFMGNIQRLSNGNSLIGWGALPRVTEVRPDGTKAFELAMGAISYRAFRFAWEGLPAELPRAALRTAGNPTAATLYGSWNGATQITGYQVYAGSTAGAMSLITTTVRTGFETMIPLAGLNPATCVFKIRPVHQSGGSMPFSANVYRLDQPACLSLLHLMYFPFVANE